MKWIARVFIFTIALVFGTFAAYLFSSPVSGLSNCTLSLPEPIPPIKPADKTLIRAESLLGTWKGAWGYDSAFCTLQIDRVEGNAFYGRLRKEGALIRFAGTFEPATRTLRFNETKIVRLGPDMSEWSLGKNTGFISPDARTLTGIGHDKWGQYTWSASNY
jgi:hypothetical protein